MKLKNIKIKKLLEYQYSLLILFLIIVALILNFNINKSIKLIFLVLATIICFFYPTLLIPFGASIYVLYLLNSKKRNNNIEGFEDSSLKNKDYFNLGKYFNNPGDKYFDKDKLLLILYKNDFIEFVENNVDKFNNQNSVKNKYKLVKDLSDCYFFNIKDDDDIIINKY